MEGSTRRQQAFRKAKLSNVVEQDTGLAAKAEPRLLRGKRPNPAPLPTDPLKKVKVEEGKSTSSSFPSSSFPHTQNNSNSSLYDKKLLLYTKYNHESPFPSYPHPTCEEVKTALSILTSLHGPRSRPTPAKLVAPADRSGCGDSPSVLDALVRTILSQNTSDTNSARAKRSMDAAYGSSDRWDAIVDGGQTKLENAIRCGGLGAVKSRVILQVLQQVKARYGTYSLEALRQLPSNDEVMRELLSFKGVGPKTASCVMLFSLGRQSFAVDTHVWRITGLLGWRPRGASRDETHLHLDARVPDEDKYALHRLLVAHGKECGECKANGRSVGKCALRNEFRRVHVEEQGQEGLTDLSLSK
ncbi:hypothetical protein OQA88_4859 [Cercophora sp. LCS_1]